MKTKLILLIFSLAVIQLNSQTLNAPPEMPGMQKTSNINQYQQSPDDNFCSLDARLIAGDSICVVEGFPPLEYKYDDGTHEDLVIWATAGGQTAVRFSPITSYPFTITGGKINVGDGTFPAGADYMGTDFRIIVYDDNGEDNLPGTALDSVTVTVDRYEWIKFGGLNAEINDGTFYIAMKQLNDPLSSAPVGVDNQQPIVNGSYVKQPGSENWVLSSYQDIMIRALTCTGYEIKSTNEDNTWYQLGRVSDFDPNNGETPQDGILTVIDSLSLPMYEDSLFYTLPLGYYAYALRIITNDTDTTAWYYTNTIQRVPLSVKNHNFANSVKIYPNPANDKIFVQSKEAVKTITINTARGKIVFDKKVNNKSFSIDICSLKEGLYIVQITAKTGAISKKIVVER
jgi:hypothetical protein